MSKKIHVTTTVNGEAVEFLCEARQSLLEVLRDTLRLTGAKEGCNNGNCGACTVILDGVPVNSCLVLAVEAEGAALQCGVCTPGFLVAAKALRDKNPDTSEREISINLDNNLCRCTGYDKI